MAIDFEAIKASVDLVNIAGRYVELKNVGKEFHGPCPFCGGNDRFHVYSDRQNCHCRKCEKTWDVIALLADKDGCTAVEAAKLLSGVLPSPTTLPVRPQGNPNNQGQAVGWDSEEWQDKAKMAVTLSRNALTGSSGGLARDYLASRGLSATTIAEFELGYSPSFPWRDSTRPAIVLPWRLVDRRISALKYRFIDGLVVDGRESRFASKSRSAWLLFGSNLCTQNETAICIEGEFNAMAVRQACNTRGVDAISFGAEGNRDGINAAAGFLRDRPYKNVLTWCDNADRSRAAGKVLAEFSPKLMQSPEGLDANDILKQFGADGLWHVIAAQISKGNQPPLSTEFRPGFKFICERFRKHFDAIYEVADEQTKRLLKELDSLVLTAQQEKSKRALDLAEQVRLWCEAQEPLTGQALATKVKEIFNTEAPRPTA